MSRIYIENIAQYSGQIVTLKGWLYNKRTSGKLFFLQLRDGTGVIQCVVFKGDVSEEAFETARRLTQESSLEITGTIKEDKRSPLGFEMNVTDIKLIQLAEEYPITPKEHGIDYLMNLRHLWLRSSKQHAILRIRTEIIKASRDFFDGKGFTCLDAPIFTPNACEGTTNLFETDYFDLGKAYLTQSGQLYMEAGALAFGKVYCFGPTFRAEKSKTRRHLSEFWMIEPEVAFNDLKDNMDLAEEYVEYIVSRVLKNRQMELNTLERDISLLEKVKRPFPRISYDEACGILKSKGHEFQEGDDFGAEDETIISESFDRPVMIHRYPYEVKAFYMKRDPENSHRALCVDMIAPEGYGEIIGGGQREDDYSVLLERIKSHGLSENDFSWYLDLRKYGSVPHSGFGLGIERTVSWICNVHHVRECIPFARTLGRLTP